MLIGATQETEDSDKLGLSNRKIDTFLLRRKLSEASLLILTLRYFQRKQNNQLTPYSNASGTLYAPNALIPT